MTTRRNTMKKLLVAALLFGFSLAVHAGDKQYVVG